LTESRSHVVENERGYSGSKSTIGERQTFGKKDLLKALFPIELQPQLTGVR
jgi:hypothetical protein